MRREGGFLRRGGGFLRRFLSKGNRRWAASSEGGGGFLRRGGVLKHPMEVLKEFDPLPPTLSVSP